MDGTPKTDAVWRIRPAAAADLEAVTAIWQAAKLFMRGQGLPQWQQGYPDRTEAEEDLAAGQSWLAAAPDGRIGAVCAFTTQPEPDYGRLSSGAWRCGEPYGTLHRLAAAPWARGQGAAGALAAFCAERCRALGLAALRSDTHPENRPMRALLQRAGFVYAGTFLLGEGLEAGGVRVGYERPVQ